MASGIRLAILESLYGRKDIHDEANELSFATLSPERT
jgi:hypothetical protein